MAKPSDLALSVEIEWTTPPTSAEEWARLRDLGSAYDVTDDNLIDLGPIIVSEKQIGAIEMIRSDTSMGWHLHVVRLPSKRPPASVAEPNVKVGGAAGLRDLIMRGLAPGSTPVAGYRVRAFLPDRDWRCLALQTPPAANDPILRLDAKANVEQIGYRLEEGPLGLAEVVIVYQHARSRYLVEFRAKGVVDFGETLALPYVDSVLELAIGTFFEVRNGSD